MLQYKRQNFCALTALSVVIALSLVLSLGCAKEPVWNALNQMVAQQQKITFKERADLIDTGIIPNLEPGKVTNKSTLPTVEFAPGVKGVMYWGMGALVNFMTMDPDAEIQKETLPGDRLMVMLKGSVEQLVKGEYVPMEATEVAPMYYFGTGFVGYRHCLYLEKGADNAVKAGPNGAEFVEVYYPIRLDYMTKTGAIAPTVKEGNYNAIPNFPANEIFNWWDIQTTQLVPNTMCWSRLFNSKGAQISMLFMGPESVFGHHAHPEEQIMIVLKGECDEIILDGKQMMHEGDIVYLPSNMIHGGMMGKQGADVIDVFWPVRPDYQALEKARNDAYHAIIPAGEKPVLLADGATSTAANSKKMPGLQFTEGPAWMDGKLYFSSMWFDIPAGTWELNPKMSDTVAMETDGTYKYISSGIHTNGLMAKGNGNLVACDMAGHRLIEMSPTGRIVKALCASMADGTRLDGPNDLVIDAKGGIFFTDPQFISTELKRPWKTVNYLPAGSNKAICVIENLENKEFGMPNGVLLSPDGKTLYVNNTYQNAMKNSEAQNWLYAYDVNDDGTLSNKRRHSEQFLHVSEYFVEQEGTVSRSSCADGMTIDELGNVYVGTNIGLQIVNPAGEYIGMVYTPTFPVSCCFGGENFDTIYMTCWDKIYSIKTNVKGLVYPLK